MYASDLTHQKRAAAVFRNLQLQKEWFATGQTIRILGQKGGNDYAYMTQIEEGCIADKCWQFYIPTKNNLGNGPISASTDGMDVTDFTSIFDYGFGSPLISLPGCLDDAYIPLNIGGVDFFFNGVNYYAYTDEKGQFGAFIEESIPTSCSNNCSIYLSTWQTAEYTSKRYEFTTLGDQSNLAIGGVNTVVTVRQPISGGFIPNKWGYVAIEEFDGSKYVWQPGTNTNELGQVGLSLTDGKKYRLTAYPNWEKEGSFSPKSLEIESFSHVDSATITMQFDLPNLSISVK
ncbi:hypothetical protein EBV26_14645, partial [bacterium]|nr:hypothetical protein [bacterium]